MAQSSSRKGSVSWFLSSSRKGSVSWVVSSYCTKEYWGIQEVLCRIIYQFM